MDVRPGYKQTEVGVLPADWPLVRFSELFEFRNGVNAEKRAYGQGTRFINVLEIITHSHLRAADIPGRVSLPKNAIDAFSVRYGDVVFNRTSETQDEVGLSAVYRDEEAVVFGGFVVRGRPKLDALDADYCGYALRAPIIRSQIVARGQGAIRANVGQADLRQVIAPVPSISEQRAIAVALSDVDGLLAKLNALVAKKHDLKQATMQQLLTGQTRLPGFSGEWEMVALEQIGTRATGFWGATHKDEAHSRLARVIRAGDISPEGQLTDTAIRFLSEPEFSRAQCRLDDLVITTSGNGLGKVWWCDGRPSVVGSNFVRVLRPQRDRAVGRFIGYVLRSAEGEQQLLEHTATSAYPNLRPTYFSARWISLPAVIEQSAIATILSDMDAEIAALEARRDKTRVLKQGMMQELLTGRIRLVQPETKPEDAMPSHDQLRKAANDGRNWAFNEAVIISVLAENFADASHPLGRMRYTKLSYLLHRYANEDTEGYLKKAAGPYNPGTRYKGPERIAQTSGYVKAAKAGNLNGFVAGEQAYKACTYFDKWYGPTALEWLRQFRYEKNEALELLTTVDKAVEELRSAGKEVTVQSVKEVLLGEPEWKPKLERPMFSDEHIQAAILRCQRLFGAG